MQIDRRDFLKHTGMIGLSAGLGCGIVPVYRKGGVSSRFFGIRQAVSAEWMFEADRAYA